MPRDLTPDLVERLTKAWDADPTARLLQNAVTTTSVDDIALDRHVVTSIDHSVSHLLDDWTATSQEKSGRCWLFAGTNLLRAGARKKLGVKDFEFSQNHLLFWDKLEKANHWLESIIATSDRDVDDRTVAHLLATPAEDGGQWNMFVALVLKHGLVPKVAMPETKSSSNTRQMNRDIATILRQAARDLRAEAADGADPEALEVTKEQALAAIHRLLCIHLGTPPESFVWQWKDSDGAFHRDGELTPLEFAEAYVTVPLADYVCLVNDPRPTSPYGRTFTVEHLGNVVGAPPVTYLNVEPAVMKSLAARAIVDGEPVWFGCDTGQMSHADLGLWDASLFDRAAVYGTQPSLTKADRLLHHESLMTHAMLFTGVDLVDDVPRRWRVENSWGTEKGDKGFMTMNDSWFAEFVFEVAVRRYALPADLQAALEQDPVVLPAWDPMGALAD
ncbi:aminopeptidase C [Intrasporangium chromatireducens Q5-1]|uniref:Aminopeptidase n=1 Tax=Intrasporangium chromatireducens Q5-1 TaxID=584657 RepID=W9GJ98_9MICO|nr:C1 family peptidase [Intrasporangium chromatireducens]EWT04893.1 aminopeptidase C [Intrasporangium chromatireducens Q5-1]